MEQDWKDVHLTLASADPGSGLQPGSLPNRTLRKVKYMPRVLITSPVMERAAMDVTPNMIMRVAPPVDIREMATFAAWDLGTRTVPTGRPVLFELARGSWRASFIRLARPDYGGKTAWLMAEVRLPETVDWPHDPAQYSVDGSPVEVGAFMLSGNHEDMFFGRDSRVTVDMKQDLHQNGSKGFVGERQAHNWKWTIGVTNSHTQPIAVCVEDPKPQTGDSAIEVEVVAKLAPVVKDHVNTWNLTILASGKSVIDCTIEASAPEDMRLIYGRQRRWEEEPFSKGFPSPDPSLSPSIPLPHPFKHLVQVAGAPLQGAGPSVRVELAVLGHEPLGDEVDRFIRGEGVPGLDCDLASHCGPERMEILLVPDEYLIDEFPGGGTLQQRRYGARFEHDSDSLFPQHQLEPECGEGLVKLLNALPFRRV